MCDVHKRLNHLPGTNTTPPIYWVWVLVVTFRVHLTASPSPSYDMPFFLFDGSQSPTARELVLASCSRYGRRHISTDCPCEQKRNSEMFWIDIVVLCTRTPRIEGMYEPSLAWRYLLAIQIVLLGSLCIPTCRDEYINMSSFCKSSTSLSPTTHFSSQISLPILRDLA